MCNKKDELQELTKGKSIYLWGAMIVGQGVCRSLERNGFAVAGFLDINPALQSQQALGYDILAPEKVFHEVKSEKAVILISSGHCDFEIEEECRNQGFIENTHYIPSRMLNDLDPSIDVAGICNLRCISCPRGNMPRQDDAGMMNYGDYVKVVDKLLDEIPFLGSIQMYTWGEPLLNKQLPEMIAYTREKQVLTAISSNLNPKADYEAVVKAKPDWFKVSVSGYGEGYSLTHTGGNWDVFFKNLLNLVALRDTHHPSMQIVINYHLYKHNVGEQYQNMAALCEKYNLIFRPSPAYLYPLDHILAYTEGQALGEKAEETLELLLMDIDTGLKEARKKKHIPCPEERCLPISWDRKVRLCGVYYKPYVVDDFLTTSVKDIIAKRKKSELCRVCVSKGLHHFTGVYLPEKRVDDA